jgi:broad specificity phosphatase PhoE
MDLVLIRHGESTANVAREQAEADEAEVIAVDSRDADVPLSELGAEQACAVGRWLARTGAAGVAATALASPYVRARRTGELALAEAGWNVPLMVDERLRDKELGVLDTLTLHGVRTRFPQEWDRRRWLGKFYYRPPGGESWVDMALRIRSFLRDLPGDDATGDVVVFTHDAMIMLFRYVCENLDEAALLELAANNTVGNCSITRLRRVGRGWELVEFNRQDHLIGPNDDDLRTGHGGDPDVHPA